MLTLKIFSGGFVAHKHYSSPAIEKRVAENDIVFDFAVCREHGRLKVPPDYARLCQKCFPGDRRTVKEWKEANERSKATAAADSLFGVSGMKSEGK